WRACSLGRRVEPASIAVHGRRRQPAWPWRHARGVPQEIGGDGHNPRLVLTHPERTVHRPHRPPPRLLDDPRGGERLDVRRGTPVQDGQFLSAHLDAQVAHAHAGRGGEQMLHRAHRCALPQSDTSLRVAHHAGGRFDRGGGGTVHAHKHDAGAERGRLAHHRRGISGVNADARACHRPADRPLRNRDHPALRWRGGESVCSIRCSAACCLRPSRWGRAGFPENTAPSGTSLVTADLARIVARAPMWTWSFTPICPANTAPSPMMTLPAIPHWATITTPRP